MLKENHKRTKNKMLEKMLSRTKKCYENGSNRTRASLQREHRANDCMISQKHAYKIGETNTVDIRSNRGHVPLRQHTTTTMIVFITSPPS